MIHDTTSAVDVSMAQPPDTETAALARFDACVKAGKIFYDDSPPEIILDNGFTFEFHVTSILNTKPVHSNRDIARTKAFTPFSNPDPDGIVADTGNHWVIFNKYNVLRPMLVIATKEYASQNDDLNEHDVDAGWQMLHMFETPYVVIYNCGTKAGSSIGHKHMQAFPLPSDRALWPAGASSETEPATSLPSVPMKHFVLRLAANSTSATVYQNYLKLLDLAHRALQMSGSDSRGYNVMFTRQWIAVVPRRTAHGPYGANSFGMLGVIVVPDRLNKDAWEDLGFGKLLSELSLPVNVEADERGGRGI